MSHPFKVGGKYYNRNGQYEVIEIGSTEMVIRYANGETQRVNINLQQQIWENWQIEQELENEKRQSTNAPKSKTAARPKALDEQKIYRFMENDFKPSVAGTVWRAKNNLAGQLA